MMLLAGRYHPAMTQLFYRIGDSTTNCFTPVMPYLWVTLKVSQDMFDPKLKIGTFVSNLFPIGMILLGFGIVQVGLSLKSHDPSQRANGFLTLAGGLVITFAKEILNLITG